MKLQKLLSYVRQAVDTYEMIEAGDKICVGVSGGKDSFSLLIALNELKKFYPKKYEVCAALVSMGFGGVDISPLQDFCKKEKIELSICQTQIAEIIFEARKEKNPCSLCSNMRRGALHNEAARVGATKLALGHNKDDAIETFFLSLFYEGRINTFEPATKMTLVDIIRPLIYIPERQIKGFVKLYNVPVISNPCPANHHTKREEMKNRIKQYKREFDRFDEKVFGAIERKLWNTPHKSETK